MSRNLVGRGQPQELGKPLRDILASLTLEGGTNLLQRGANHAPCGWTPVTRHESGKAEVGRVPLGNPLRGPMPAPPPVRRAPLQPCRPLGDGPQKPASRVPGRWRVPSKWVTAADGAARGRLSCLQWQGYVLPSFRDRELRLFRRRQSEPSAIPVFTAPAGTAETGMA